MHAMFNTNVFWKGCTNFAYIDCFRGQIDLHWFPSNLPKIKALKNSEESGKNQKTFYCSWPNIKYELHESL